MFCAILLSVLLVIDVLKTYFMWFWCVCVCVFMESRGQLLIYFFVAIHFCFFVFEIGGLTGLGLVS